MDMNAAATKRPIPGLYDGAAADADLNGIPEPTPSPFDFSESAKSADEDKVQSPRPPMPPELLGVLLAGLLGKIAGDGINVDEPAEGTGNVGTVVEDIGDAIIAVMDGKLSLAEVNRTLRNPAAPHRKLVIEFSARWASTEHDDEADRANDGFQ